MLSFPTHIWFGEVEDLEALVAEYVVKELEEDPGLVEVLSRQHEKSIQEVPYPLILYSNYLCLQQLQICLQTAAVNLSLHHRLQFNLSEWLLCDSCHYSDDNNFIFNIVYFLLDYICLQIWNIITDFSFLTSFLCFIAGCYNDLFSKFSC